VRLILEGAGFRCVAAENVRDALRLVHTERPKLVLAETALPGGSGAELARRIAAEGGWRPRIALMSAYPRQSRGFEDIFLPKPIQFDNLLNLLESIERESWPA